MDDRFEQWAPLIPLAALFDDSRLFLDGFCIELRAFPQNKNMCLEKLVFHWLADVSVAFMNCASETLQIRQDKQSHQLSREGSKPMRDDLPTSDFVRLPDQYADTKNQHRRKWSICTERVSSSNSAIQVNMAVVLVVKLVGHHACGADRIPVAVRFPAGPRVRLKTVDPPKGNGLGQKKTSQHGICQHGLTRLLFSSLSPAGGCWTMYRSHTSSLLWPPTRRRLCVCNNSLIYCF